MGKRENATDVWKPTGTLVVFLSLPPFEQRVARTHGDRGPGQRAGALTAGARRVCRARGEAGTHQSCSIPKTKLVFGPNRTEQHMTTVQQ